MKVVIMKDHIGEQIKQYSKKMSKSLTFLGITAIGVPALFLPFNLWMIAIILFVIGVSYFGYKLNEYSQKKIIFMEGRKGELIVRNALQSELSDDYTAFVGVPVKNGDIDCLITGPTGVFALEIKNHKGDIVYSEDGWKHYKTGIKGGVYQGNLKNPEKQLFQAMHSLKDKLKQYNADVYIKGVVVFSNPATNLVIEKQPQNFEICRVDDLVDVIKNNNHKLSKEKIDQIHNALSVIQKEQEKVEA